MDHSPPPTLRERNRQLARDLVLDAAERLLAKDAAGDFSMRALAAEAGVGFATPFNHFGNKNAIMRALSERVIERMAGRFMAEPPAGDAIERVLAMTRIAVGLLLEQPRVYRTVVGSLCTVDSGPNGVRDHSQALWAQALGEFDGIARKTREIAKASLAEQLAFMFRGCLSFWIAGEVDDASLERKALAGMASVLLGFASSGQERLLEVLGLGRIEA